MILDSLSSNKTKIKREKKNKKKKMHTKLPLQCIVLLLAWSMRAGFCTMLCKKTAKQNANSMLVELATQISLRNLTAEV